MPSVHAIFNKYKIKLDSYEQRVSSLINKLKQDSGVKQVEWYEFGNYPKIIDLLNDPSGWKIN